MSDEKVNGLINFKDLAEIYDSKDELEMHKREKEIDFEAATNIQFTSGTTGFPKGATLSHFNILNNALYIGSYLHLTPHDLICAPVPLYHCFGMVIGNLCVLNYGTGIIYPSEGFDPVAAMQCVTKYKATGLYGVPTMFIAMLEEYEKNKDKYNTKSLRTGFIAGSICPEALMERIINELNMNEFATGYGLTECSPVVTLCDASDSIKKKS